MDRKQLTEKLYDLQLLYIKSNRFFEDSYLVSLSDVHILAELRAYPGLSAGQLHKRLMLSKPKLSRAIRSLIDLGLIRKEVDLNDGRIKRLYITADAPAVLSDIDHKNESFLKGCERNLSSLEMDKLTAYTAKLADGYGAPEAATIQSEHQMRAPVRRITRVNGRIGSASSRGSVFSTLEWQLVTRLLDSEKPMIASDLKSELDIKPNTLSDALSRLESRKYLKKLQPLLHDRRKVPLALSEQGRQAVEEARKKALAENYQAVAHFSDHELSDFVGLLERFLTGKSGIVEENKLELVLVPEVRARKLDCEADRTRARVFYLKHQLKADTLHKVPSRLFCEDSWCFVLECGGEIQATIEIQSREDESWFFTNYAMSELYSMQWKGSFLEFVKRVFKENFPGSKYSYDKVVAEVIGNIIEVRKPE